MELVQDGGERRETGRKGGTVSVTGRRRRAELVSSLCGCRYT